MQEAGKWKPVNDKAIVSNIELVFKTGDISKLNKPTYEFVMNMSGFIAHYNLYGFQEYYTDLRDFSRDLLDACTEYEANRDETDRDFVKWYGQDYCSSKARAKRGIADVVRKYQGRVSVESEAIYKTKLENLNDLLAEVVRRNDPQITKSLVDKLGL